MDKEEVNGTAAMVMAIRRSIQEAYNITKVLEHIAEEGEGIDPKEKQMYWDILYDCAKHIRLNLNEYSLGYIPVNPFDEEEMKGNITPFSVGRKRRGNRRKNYF